MPEDVAVEITGLTKRFGAILALDDVSLSIYRGEFFSLLGPSGCGKTTLLRVIGGFETPSTGDVRIDGKSVLRQPPYLRSTNMIFQHLALFPHMSIFDNIAFGLRMKRVPAEELRRRVGASLALVRLEGYEGRQIEQLSGGQKQRVAIARALVNDPSVLLLDEPLGALDLQLRLQMVEELKRLHKSLNSTFVFVTHDQGEAMAMSDRIAVMNDGRILQIDTPEAIYETPETRFVATFIGHTNLIEGRVAEAQSAGWYRIECGSLSIRCRSPLPLQTGSHATVALRYEKVDISDIAPSGEPPSCQAVVMEKTYMGSIVRFSTRLADGLVLTSDVTDMEKARGLAEGDSVALSWPDDSVTLVRD